MPELPEVETIVSELQSSDIIGKKIIQAHIYWPRIVETPSSKEFVKKITGQCIINIERRGKYIVFHLSKSTLLVHLRMTGKFLFNEEKEPVDKHEHVRLILSEGTILSYQDTRKFGRWSLYDDATEKLGQLGLEPLSKAFTEKALEGLLQNHSSQIKPFLLNQRHLVGLGNIYVDESLWEAKIHPQRLTNSLSKSEVQILHRAIQHVLQVGVENQGTSLGKGKGNYFSVSGRRGGHQHKLQVFRQDGRECPRCHELIKKTVVAQRGTHYCPICQKI